MLHRQAWKAQLVVKREWRSRHDTADEEDGEEIAGVDWSVVVPSTRKSDMGGML